MKKSFVPLVCLGLWLLPSALSQAASDYLLVLDGVEGESVDPKYRGAIEVQSFSWGASNPSTVGGGGTGKVQFQDFHFTKSLDKASPLLALRCASGEHIKSATLIVRRTTATGEPLVYYTITLTDLLVSSVSSGSGAGSSGPAETLSLNFSKIEWSYVPVSADGLPQAPVQAGWDLATNTRL